MRKKLAMLIIPLMMAGLTGIAYAQSTADFSGTWVLDTKKTREVPPGLKSYVLTVKQQDNQISFEAKIDGNLNPAAAQDQPRTSNLNTFGEVTGQAVSSGASTGVAGSAFTDPGTMSSSSKVNVAHGRAFSTVVRRMNCRLDGEERVREIGGISPGRMRRKAVWKDPKKSLELYIARDFDTQGSVVTSTVREFWELADGGRELRIKRTVNLLAGWDDVTLVFARQ
ncbi:MAG: hypothetical protein IPM66_02860 [Acidobacteriota bacterium]|nr:MAG: hypothetical protein IPM66_02860 [Acidobacteriota bacterium]